MLPWNGRITYLVRCIISMRIDASISIQNLISCVHLYSSHELCDHSMIHMLHSLRCPRSYRWLPPLLSDDPLSYAVYLSNIYVTWPWLQAPSDCQNYLDPALKLRHSDRDYDPHRDQTSTYPQRRHATNSAVS